MINFLCKRYINLFIFSLVIVSGSLQAQVLKDSCYTIPEDQGILVRLDKATGGETTIGSLGLADTEEVEAIAFSPNSDTLFASNGADLGFVDLTTGAYTLIGSFGSGDGADGILAFDDVDGLTWDPVNNVLFASVRVPGQDILIRVDRSTGAHIPDAFGPNIDYVRITGPLILADVDDIAINPADGEMYAVANTSTNNDILINIDKNTGVSTKIGDVLVDNMEGFGFSNDGLLYATTGKSSGAGTDNSFFSLDIGTGNATLITNLTTGQDYESCDCMVLPFLYANDDRDTTNLNLSIVINVQDNDFLGLTPTFIVVVVPGSNGSVAINGGTSVTYTPDPGFVGTDTFTYTIIDNEGFSSTATVTVVVVEVDTDDDGVPDRIDLDDDNDGIPDIIEVCGEGAIDFSCLGGDPAGDPDTDGILNYQDPDFCTLNANGICTNLDSDGDGIPDYLDLDSDNDGITDLTEAGGTDVDGDGLVDGFTDTNNNGLDDSLDPALGGTALPVPDTDGDTILDFIDLDSDNDGIADVVEAGGEDTDGDGTIDGFTDSNGDGYDDNTEATPLPLPNSDGDGFMDYIDIDADNDGIIDNIEAQTTAGYRAPSGNDSDQNGWDDEYDVNNSGTTIVITDTDSDTTPDYLDEDSDDDTIPDTTEGHDGNSNGVVDLLEGGGTLDTGDDDSDGLYNSYDPDFLASCPNTDLGQPANGGCAPLQDTDNSGDRDWRDDDDDNDGILTKDEPTDADGSGIPDYLEGPEDNDNDGIPDILDSDDDNDGIPDVEEACGPGAIDFSCLPGSENPSGDTDGDGTPNYQDPDFCTLNANGVCDILDSDGDGIIDQFDLDSDNDGIPDITEAGGGDLDSDGDGVIDDLTDADGDGLADVVDPDQGGTPLPNPDSDGDGIPDTTDLDSDNDGIPDIVEAGGGDLDLDGDGRIDDLTDADGDGLLDVVDPDQGGTPLPNPGSADVDSDDDGITDVTEAGGVDADGDGVIDGFMDADSDGLADSVDPDQGGTPLPIPDSDTDGFSDYLDIDVDNDGIIDNIEGQTTADYVAPTGNDTDGDGLDDAYDPDQSGILVPRTDTDSDLTPDYLDDDSDNDTILDTTEGHDGNSNGTPDILEGGGTLDTGDDDNDGLYNSYDPDFLASCDNTDLGQPANGGCAPLQDTDGTDDRDWRDDDDDGDGILTADEPTDADGTGIPDYLEGFGDNDGDGVNDLIDQDDDNDGILDVVEACGLGAIDFSCLPGGENPVSDSDGDGTPNYQDPDFCTLNANGVCDILDEDGDGVIDQFDLDSDNDGIPDITEAGGGSLDVNSDGVIDDLTDADKDGIIDIVDPDQGGTPLLVPDTDGDGVSDFKDLDSDNDGIPDITEAGGEDADGDGIIDGFMDMDQDGLADSVDPTQGGTPLPVPNSDADANPDYLDIDADDDGIIDNIESQSTDGYRPASGTDADGDGYDDAYDPTEGGTPVTLEDTDVDNTPDYIDEDTDNDGVPDTIEGHDSDSNGEPDLVASSTDSDSDGLDDAYDPDFITCNTNEQGQPQNGGCAAIQNTDGTDDRDWRDTDDENDGAPTLEEGADDCDNDGIPNYLDDRDICDRDLEIYNAFSPNGDNRNDVWIIDGIEKFPNNTVKIYNRWGNLVWQISGYDNQANIWGGESNEGIIIGEKMVPDGSYFYVIDLGNGSDAISGYVVIHR